MNKIGIIALLLVTGCSTVEVAPGMIHYNDFTDSELREEHARRHGSDPGPIAGFVDFEQRDGDWVCLIFTSYNQGDKACTLQHEIDLHCEPGLAHAKGYGDKASRGSIIHAAGRTHPRFGPDGHRYRDCGHDTHAL